MFIKMHLSWADTGGAGQSVPRRAYRGGDGEQEQSEWWGNSHTFTL